MSEQNKNSPEWDAIVNDAKNLFKSVKTGINVLIKKYSNKLSETQKSAEPKSEPTAKSTQEVPKTPNEVPKPAQEQPNIPNEQPPETPKIEVPPPAAPVEPEMKSPTEEGTQTDSDDKK